MSVSSHPIATMESNQVAEAYAGIAAFFDCYALSVARKDLAAYLKAAISHGSCKRSDPAEVLYFFEMLEKLMDAVWVLVQSGSKRSKAVLVPENEEGPDMTDFSRYCGWHRGDLPWDFFPRHLSKKEYKDPYKALKKVTARCSPVEWKECFRQLVTSSLSRGTIGGYYEAMNPLEIYILLNKLMEACHLIEVRAIDQVDAWPRPKWKEETKASMEAPAETEPATENQFK